MNVTLKHIRQRLAPQSFPDTTEDLARNDVLIRVVVIQYRNLTGFITKEHYRDSFHSSGQIFTLTNLPPILLTSRKIGRSLVRNQQGNSKKLTGVDNKQKQSKDSEATVPARSIENRWQSNL